MREIFLGRPVFWTIWALLAPLMLALGQMRMHVVNFNLFLLLLTGATMVCIVFVVVKYREGEAITREPIEEANLPTE